MIAYRASLVVALLFGLALQVAMFAPLAATFLPCPDDQILSGQEPGSWICMEDVA